ncbi:hypothetical protein CXK93_21800 [Stutzerimonas decontaminans]|uniref:Uncharacterized protein n=1 Tax=Stutzerimonas decontaminans TaxID=3022791 RepID=A0ABX4VRK6_9GAMM|nr:hypothetical protein CXK93_21800 [Stutzerimonas decontaminans]
MLAIAVSISSQTNLVCALVFFISNRFVLAWRISFLFTSLTLHAVAKVGKVRPSATGLTINKAIRLAI